MHIKNMAYSSSIIIEHFDINQAFDNVNVILCIHDIWKLCTINKHMHLYWDD